jgi:hypothetical protein
MESLPDLGTTQRCSPAGTRFFVNGSGWMQWRSVNGTRRKWFCSLLADSEQRPSAMEECPRRLNMFKVRRAGRV